MRFSPSMCFLLWACCLFWACENPPILSPQASPPQADAGQDLRSQVREVVILDGMDSQAADNSPLGFSWAQVEGPPISIQHAGTGRAQVIPTAEGVYVFRLTVTDGRGLSASDEVVMVVTLSHTDGVLQISAAPLGPEVAKVEYTIAAADIDTLAGELLITADQTAQKTLLAVPPGRDRLIELFAHNDANEVVAFGSALVQIQENETVVVAIEMLELRSLRGSIEIEAVFEGVSQEGG